MNKIYDLKVKAKDLSKLYTSIIDGETEIFKEELGRLFMDLMKSFLI